MIMGRRKVSSTKGGFGKGIYLCWFEHSTNTLQLLTGVV